MLKKFCAYIQYILPQHLLSRLAGGLAESRTPWIKNFLIFVFMKRYNVDMSIAAIEDPYAYPTFNSFFIRALKKDARPIDQEQHALVVPADGTIAQIGYVNKTSLLQAKNFNFNLSTLLADDASLTTDFTDGAFATFYLAPHNYHRVHMPLTGKLKKTIYVPGKLFSVNQVTAACIPNLYSRNERLICLFETEAGPLVIIFVGAMIVGSIQTIWMNKPVRNKQIIVENFENNIEVAKGAELGYFKMGSTVILLCQKHKVVWSASLTPNSTVQFGQFLAKINAV